MTEQASIVILLKMHNDRIPLSLLQGIFNFFVDLHR